MIIYRLKATIIILSFFILFAKCKKEEIGIIKPNIILIVADDLGYGDLGCYGQVEIQTPNIDKLAEKGIRFTDHYAGSTVCAPSRASLLTGLHTGHTQIRGNYEVKPMGQKPLTEGTTTVATKLKEAGYTTGLIGKWGLGGPGSSGTPNKQGFDYFFGYLCQRHAHNYFPEFLFRNQDSVLLKNVVQNERLDGAGEAIEKNEYAHDIISDEVLEFIEANKDGPFFLVHTPTIPHANNEAGQRGMEIPNYGIYENRDWPDAQKGHAAMITLLDADVGRIVSKLKELGISENTILFFTSDNGPHREGGNDPEFNNSSGKFRGIKRDLYEGGIRIPMIAYWPGKIEAGGESDLVSAFWDYLPTFCDLAGLDIPQNTDGISMVPTLFGKGKQKKHQYLYWEFHEDRSTKQAVRIGDYKIVSLDPHKSKEVYNLKIDPSESNNIVDEQTDLVKKAVEIFNMRTESKTWPLKIEQ